MEQNRFLLIIKDELRQYEKIFKSIKKDANFPVEIINIASLLDGKYGESIQMYTPNDLVICIKDTIYKDKEKPIREYLRKVFNHAFTNYIIMCNSPSILKEKDVIQGKKHCFYLNSKSNHHDVSYNLILYVIKIFNEAILTYRLMDYITNTFEGIVDSELLKKKKQEIEQLNEELARKNKIDSLTNLFNRQAIFEFLDKENKRTRREIWRINSVLQNEVNISKDMPQEFKSSPRGALIDHYGVYSVMMIDVDHFKKINDTYGHLIGDNVLRTIGKLLQDPKVFRESDLVGRFGGEEFIAILPSTNVKFAVEPAKRFCDELKKIKFISNKSEIFKVSVSIGISEYHQGDKSKEEIIQRSDKALYWAKEHGRDQIIIYEKVFK